MDSENTSTGHLAWCGLVALQLAKHDGTVITPGQESLFLTRWLAVAEKQRRFRRELAAATRCCIICWRRGCIMEREDILLVLRAHPDNCIRGYHRDHPLGTGRTEGRVLVRHYGGLIPDEIVLTTVMFLKVQEVLCVSESWGTVNLGGCTWCLKEPECQGNVSPPAQAG